MLLQELLYKVQTVALTGSVSVKVTDVQSDSRAVNAGCCFIALRGTLQDGHQFIQTAIDNGASVIVAEDLPEMLHPNVTYVTVKNAAHACSIISHNFYGEPSNGLKVVGVTGTNGKTTITTLLFNLFTDLGYKCGLIGTVEIRIGEEVIVATHTTPDAISLNKLLAKMKQEDCTHVFMECSSHALHQHRTTAVKFAGAIFTNITHDHLDYHTSFNEYIRVKKMLFDNLSASDFALVNIDDKRGMIMLQNTSAKKLTYSLKTLSNFKGKILENALTGLHMNIDEMDVYFKLIGEFNAYNLLAVYGAAVSLGETKYDVLLALSKVNGAEGRFDRVQTEYRKVLGIVDYAHTPDALLNVLATINNIREGNGRLITVVGCGGNRDKTKRPLMAEVACEHSDKVIFTSDNPRNENPEDIIREMEVGVKITQKKKFVSVTDRREAIKIAVSMSEEEDVVLVAGKGHEKYQDIKGVKYEFDDKKILMETLMDFEK